MHQRSVNERGAQGALQHAVDHRPGRAGGERQMNFRVALIKVGQGGGDPHRRGALQRTERKQPLGFIARHHHSRLVNQGEDLLAVAQKAVPAGDRRRRWFSRINSSTPRSASSWRMRVVRLDGTRCTLRRLGNAAGAGDSVKHLKLSQVHSILLL
jgi:hypothetical protein